VTCEQTSTLLVSALLWPESHICTIFLPRKTPIFHECAQKRRHRFLFDKTNYYFASRRLGDGGDTKPMVNNRAGAASFNTVLSATLRGGVLVR
jgi:hypothetical protein